MYTLPLRRTSWLARWRVRRDLNELRTFIGVFPKNNRRVEPVGNEVATYAVFANGDQP
jgi:hypothetical protein